MIQFRFSFTSIITLFMFILCEIQSQFSCYECDILLFSSVYGNYICTRKLIFSLTKQNPRLVQRPIISRFGMCQSHNPHNLSRWAMSNFTDNNFLISTICMYICTKPTYAEENLAVEQPGHLSVWIEATQLPLISK